MDLCCGQGRHSLEMPAKASETSKGSVHLSRYLITKARGLASREGLGVKFREGDARKTHYSPDAFDCVMILGNSFGYFETVRDDLGVSKRCSGFCAPTVYASST